jgi:nitroreductase
MTDTDLFQKKIEIDYAETAVDCDFSEFERVVRSRRSVRRYTKDPIPEEVMRRCLAMALLAPNSSNLQCWEFYWIRDPDQKHEVATYCLGQPAAATAQELIVCVARLDTWRRNQKLMLEMLKNPSNAAPREAIQYYERLVPLAYGQGWLYLLGPLKRLYLNLIALLRPMVRGPASRADMRVWAHKTTALACENLMLALRAAGFDSCPMEGMDERRIQRMLKLPRAAEVCMVISAGKRAPGGVYGKQIRFDPSLFVFEVGRKP